jgi:hypothetical protein
MAAQWQPVSDRPSCQWMSTQVYWVFGPSWFCRSPVRLKPVSGQALFQWLPTELLRVWNPRLL